MNTPDLSIFVEFGVGLAGFSGVVVAFSQRSGELNDYDRFRVTLLLVCSLFPAFAATLLLVLDSFGIHGEAACRWLGIFVVVGASCFTVMTIALARRMSREARESLSSTVWYFGDGGTIVMIAWNGANLLGWPRPMGFGPIAAALAWLLLLASVMFFRLLLIRIGHRRGGA